MIALVTCGIKGCQNDENTDILWWLFVEDEINVQGRRNMYDFYVLKSRAQSLDGYNCPRSADTAVTSAG